MSQPALRFRNDDGQEFPEWEETNLGDIAEVKRGAASQHLNYVDDAKDGIRLIRINDFLKNEPVYVKDTEDIKRFRVQTNDLLIAGTGATAGIVFRVPDEFNNMSFSYNAPRIRVTKAHFAFIYFYLISDIILKQQQGLFVGNAQPFLDTDAMRGFVINLPLLLEQIKIANFLTAVDEKITQLTQKHDLLTQYKKGVMQKIFSQELRFKDDDGQDFPEWEEKALKELIYIVIDNRGKTPPVKSAGNPLIEVNAIGNKDIKYSAITKYVSDETYQSWFRKHLKEGDVLFSTVGATAQCSYFKDIGVKATIAQNIVGLRFKQTDSGLFMFYLLTEKNNNQKFKTIEMGAVQPSVKVSQMIHLLFNLPSPKEQTKIANFLTVLDDKITATQTQLQAIKQYKQGLLQQMFV